MEMRLLLPIKLLLALEKAVEKKVQDNIAAKKNRVRYPLLGNLAISPNTMTKIIMVSSGLITAHNTPIMVCLY